MGYVEQHACISTSDLALLKGFLSEDVVCYFVRRVEVSADRSLVVFPHDSVVSMIKMLPKYVDKTGRKFFELSFQQKARLIDELLDDGELKLLCK